MRQTLLKLHLAVVLAGMTGILGKIITLSAEVLVWYRMLIALAVCFILLLTTKKLVILPLRELLRFLGIGILLALHWIFFYLSIKYSNVSVAVVSFSMGGFFTALFEPLVNRSKLQISELGVSLLTVLGVSLIFHFDMQFRLGIIFGVLCAALVAFFSLANAKAVSIHKPETVLFYDMLGGTAFLSIFLPLFFLVYPPQNMVPTLLDFGCLFFLATACTIGLLLLENQALQKISAFTVNLTFNLEPVYSIILAMLFFDEAKELSPSFYVGLFCIFLSVFLQTVKTLRKKQQLDALIN